MNLILKLTNLSSQRLSQLMFPKHPFLILLINRLLIFLAHTLKATIINTNTFSLPPFNKVFIKKKSYVNGLSYICVKADEKSRDEEGYEKYEEHYVEGGLLSLEE